LAIWHGPVDHEDIKRHLRGTMCEHVGIEITEIGDDYLVGTMPVDHRTTQLMGIIHGGASVVLAETVGSIAANLCCSPEHYCVGLDINANHIRAGLPPYVKGTARPLHIGSTTMVWEILITDTNDRLVCASRLTMAVLKKSRTI
jgi:1,4-dihydroxy-2-naphthoyl-CoA hydrolase